MPGAYELLGERRRRARVDAGQLRDGDERRALQHRDGAGEPRRAVAEARQRRADRARHGVRTVRATAAGSS